MKVTEGVVTVFRNKNGQIGVGHCPITGRMMIAISSFKPCLNDLTHIIKAILGTEITEVFNGITMPTVYIEVLANGNQPWDCYPLDQVLEQTREYLTKTNKAAYNKLEFKYLD